MGRGMTSLFQSLWRQVFSVSERQAIKIAMAECNKSGKAEKQGFRASKVMPRFYSPDPVNEPCWYVFAPWGDDLEGTVLRSSRIIAVSKKTGAVLYDGTANDEG